MRPLFASVLLAVAAAACLGACSPAPSDEPASDNGMSVSETPPEASADATDSQATSTADAEAGSASDAAAVSFNAGQTADTDAWFTVIEGAGACAADSSPGQAIARLQALGVTPTSVDTNAADGTLAEVALSWSDGHGQKSLTYYRTLGDCQASLPSDQAVPDRYK